MNKLCIINERIIITEYYKENTDQAEQPHSCISGEGLSRIQGSL